ncbi:MAG: hypothetical protein AAB400_04855 [Patescibacteria group bacterium]
MSIEHNYPKPMSEFSLPYLKDIPAKNRRAVMSDEWEQLATKEMHDAADYAEMQFERCHELFKENLNDSAEMRRLTQEWVALVKGIVLSFHNDVIAIAQAKKEDTREMKKSAWQCTEILEKWSRSIEKVSNKKTLRILALFGIEIMKKHGMGPEDAILEAKLVAAREVKKRMGV